MKVRANLSEKAFWIVPILACALLGSYAQATDTLCPPPPPMAPEEDDLRMGEQLFTQGEYESSLRSLKEFPQKLLGAYDLKSTVQSSETWIPYANELLIIEGWVLKQEALRDIEAKRPDGPGVERFCAFVAKTEYVD